MSFGEPSKKVVERLLDIYYERAKRFQKKGILQKYVYWHVKFETLMMIYERIKLEY